MDREDAWSMSVQVEEGVGDAVRTMPYMQISATSWTSFENSQQPQRVGFLQPCSHSAGVGGEHGERVLSFAGDSFFARILLGLLKIFSWFSIYLECLGLAWNLAEGCYKTEEVVCNPAADRSLVTSEVRRRVFELGR